MCLQEFNSFGKNQLKSKSSMSHSNDSQKPKNFDKLSKDIDDVQSYKSMGEKIIEYRERTNKNYEEKES